MKKNCTMLVVMAVSAHEEDLYVYIHVCMCVCVSRTHLQI